MPPLNHMINIPPSHKTRTRPPISLGEIKIVLAAPPVAGAILDRPLDPHQQTRLPRVQLRYAIVLEARRGESLRVEPLDALHEATRELPLPRVRQGVIQPVGPRQRLRRADRVAVRQVAQYPV